MENVILEKNGHVSKITINRPKALNALSTDVLKDLDEAVNTVKNDDDTYCLIITGNSSRNQTCQTLCTAESRCDAQAHFRLTEDCVVGCHADVAGHGTIPIA